MTDTPPKARGVRIDLDPKTEVVTSIGKVFVHEAGHDAVMAYAKQPQSADPSAAVRALLLARSSLVVRKSAQDDVVPLPAEKAGSLTSADIETMAGAYLGTLNSAYYIKQASVSKPPIRRGNDESSVQFLDRLLRWLASEERRSTQLKDLTGSAALRRALDGMANFAGATDPTRSLFEDAARSRKLVEQAFGGDASRVLADLHKNASGLSEVIREARLNRGVLDGLRGSLPDLEPMKPHIHEFRPMPSLNMPSGADELRKVTKAITDAAEQRERQRQQERAEELETNRNIHEITLKSSDLLAQLTQASASMLEKFGVFLADFRATAERADEGTRRSFSWAAWSLGITAALTIAAFVVAIMAYRQDKADIESDDRWQEEIAELLKAQAANGERVARQLATENGRLQQRIEALEKAAAAKSKRTPDKGTPPG